MSVIFGIQEENEIIIAGDKRTSLFSGDKVSDEQEKVYEINKKLAFACAGNVSIETAIIMDIHKQVNRNEMTTDDLVTIIDNFYKSLIEKQCNTIYSYTFCCLIAGIGGDGKPHLVNAGKFNTGFEADDVPMALYHPADADQNECNQIFAKNYHTNHRVFCEKTIQDISLISKLVSANGSKWVYNIDAEEGSLYQF